MEILLLYSQYICSLLMYVVNNKHLFTKNLEVHNHYTISANNFHLLITNVTKYKKKAYCTGIKNFKYLPNHIKNVANEIQVFKNALQRFLLDNSFYSVNEHF
jgi:hypothetical protein